ncbi:MAG TPA: enoyl-CoA hydratase/isomerase family protein [Xanthomonadaceae bacterium]|nr:enoyl-CoA hydratase/isomerase family protein [Xanthomonadaceae bacterium]
MSTSVDLRHQGATATLTLNRPKVHNAFDDDLIVELTAALEQLSEDESVRAVVLTGAGKSFSAGADLHWMRAMARADEKENRKDARRLARLMRTLNHLPKPTVARVNGAAFGGGVGLVACCDIAIGVREASFALSEVRLGLVPAVISPYVIDAIGGRQARRLFQSAEIIDAAEAHRIGLLHMLVPADQLDRTVDDQVALLLKGGPIALSEAKQLALRIATGSSKRRLELEEDNAELIAKLRVSDEGQEGIDAFLGKRKAGWVWGGE